MFLKWQLENLEKLCYSYSYAFDIEKNENENIFQALSNCIKKWFEFKLLHALSCNGRRFFMLFFMIISFKSRIKDDLSVGLYFIIRRGILGKKNF